MSYLQYSFKMLHHKFKSHAKFYTVCFFIFFKYLICWKHFYLLTAFPRIRPLLALHSNLWRNSKTTWLSPIQSLVCVGRSVVFLLCFGDNLKELGNPCAFFVNKVFEGFSSVHRGQHRVLWEIKMKVQTRQPQTFRLSRTVLSKSEENPVSTACI